MQALGEAELLALWERGIARHPIDRAVLLCAWARPDLPPSRLPDLPLGALNSSLLRLRVACFGSCISACVDCERCGERMEFTLDTAPLLAAANDDDAPAEFELSGLRFRVPCSRDLAMVAGQRDITVAALNLLKQCCLTHTDKTEVSLTGILAAAEAVMERLDPAADINLAIACKACGHSWLADLNIGALLWDEIDVRARTLLAEVHELARAYGWTEPEILALSPQRRVAYLDMVVA